jgi:quinol monooxygenase YgiN
MLIVAAQLDYADQAARDEAVRRSGPVQQATRDDEAGCQAYCFAADPCLPTRIQVHEAWDDEASLIAHFRHPNYHAMRELLGSLGITGSWNQVYRVDRHETVYGPGGTIRDRFFVDD